MARIERQRVHDLWSASDRRYVDLASQFPEDLEAAKSKSGRKHADAALEQAADREDAAAGAILCEPVREASDFLYKAKLIRARLNDDLSVDHEAEDLTDQIIAFYEGAGA